MNLDNILIARRVIYKILGDFIAIVAEQIIHYYVTYILFLECLHEKSLVINKGTLYYEQFFQTNER